MTNKTLIAIAIILTIAFIAFSFSQGVTPMAVLFAVIGLVFGVFTVSKLWQQQ